MKHGLDQIPGPRHAARLEELIRDLMPAAPDDQLAQALNQVQDAINAYRESFPVLDGSRRRRSSLKEARKDLKAISNGTKGPASPRTILAHQALLRSQRAIAGPDFNPTTSAESADKALHALEGRGDHEADEYRGVFASEVALALRDAIGIPISMTRDDATGKPSVGPGAAYARLLRASLLAAGGRPPIDLLPLMRAGLAVLNDSAASEG